MEQGPTPRPSSDTGCTGTEQASTGNLVPHSPGVISTGPPGVTAKCLLQVQAHVDWLGKPDLAVATLRRLRSVIPLRLEHTLQSPFLGGPLPWFANLDALSTRQVNNDSAATFRELRVDLNYKAPFYHIPLDLLTNCHRSPTGQKDPVSCCHIC